MNNATNTTNTILFTKPDNTTIRLTRKQVRAIKKIYKRSDDELRGMYPRFRDFVSLALPTFFSDGMVAFPWYGMWLAVEADGYTHS